MRTFRKACLLDADHLKAIAVRVIRENYTPFLGIDVVKDFIESGLSDKEIDDGVDSCTVMTVDEVIVGFCIVNNELLHLIMTDVPYQRKGYGSELLAYIEHELFQAYSEIRLQSFAANEKAKRFYFKNGWSIIDKQKLPDTNTAMLVFTKAKMSGRTT